MKAKVTSIRRRDLLATPRIELSSTAPGWTWTLTLRVLTADGPLVWTGAAATRATAAGAARRFMRELLGEVRAWDEVELAAGGAPALAKRSAPRPRLVKEDLLVVHGLAGELARAVKRDCESGRFVRQTVKANDCQLPARKRAEAWSVGSGRRPVTERVCYPTRADALRLFRYWNADLIDRAGGLLQPSSKGEYDAINERYGLRGARRVRTLAQAFEAVMPRGRPYCLSALDLDTLNETVPAQAVGGFRLPDVVAEARLWEKAQRAAELGELEEVPF
jgi:hypothetical protein